jgi:hypothetical protein
VGLAFWLISYFGQGSSLVSVRLFPLSVVVLGVGSLLVTGYVRFWCCFGPMLRYVVARVAFVLRWPVVNVALPWQV